MTESTEIVQVNSTKSIDCKNTGNENGNKEVITIMLMMMKS